MTRTGTPGGGTLLGTAMALMTSTVAGAGLGFAFWVVAARLFPPGEVGAMSAAVASMTLLGGVAQLNLHSVYGRFLPRAGRHTRRLLLAGFAASAVTALLLAIGFLALGMDDGVLPGHAGARLLFVIGVLATAIFLIQDGVLTALGRATSVPLKNVAASGAKLLLLAVLAGAVGSDGTLLAWTVPVIVVMLAANIWIMASLVPAHAAASASGAPARRREVLRFASAEYVNGVLNNVVAFLPPLLVTEVLGGEQGAYFYLPWIIGVSVTTLLWNVVSSFVVQASGPAAPPPAPRGRHHLPPPGHAHRQVQRAAALVAAVAGGGMVVLVLGAGPLLAVFGGEYGRGASALRLIGLSLPFTGIFILYGAFSVMEKRMWRMVAIQSAGATVFLTGAWLGLPRTGLIAPAQALLISQAAIGVVLLPGLIRRYRAVTAPGREPAWAAGDTAGPPPAVPPEVPWTERDRAASRHTGTAPVPTARGPAVRATVRPPERADGTRTRPDRASARTTHEDDRNPVPAYREL